MHNRLYTWLTTASLLLLLSFSTQALAASIDRFAGTYIGEADLVVEGEAEPRDMSVTIKPSKKGFSVTWTSIVYRNAEDRSKKSYTIEFLPSVRDNIFSSAMKTDVFGKQVPLDPLKGEPFVWSRLEGDTLSVFSLFIKEDGEYSMQEYHRTLSDGGLDLRFVRFNNGVLKKEVRAFLEREE